jgi:hypothetical protein
LIPEVTGVGTATDVYSYMSFDGGTSLFGGVIGQNFITGIGGTTPFNGWTYDSNSKTVTIYDNLTTIGEVSAGATITSSSDINSGT